MGEQLTANDHDAGEITVSEVRSDGQTAGTAVILAEGTRHVTQ